MTPSPIDGQVMPRRGIQAMEMTMYRESSRDHDVSHALTAVTASLLRTLVRKNVLSNADVRDVLTKAASEITPHEYTAPTPGAAGVILDELLPMFAEDGGD